MIAELECLDRRRPTLTLLVETLQCVRYIGVIQTLTLLSGLELSYFDRLLWVNG